MSAVHKPIEQLIEEYGEFVRPISGISMLPLLRQDKDAVRLIKPEQELSAGDVPLYKRPGGQYVLHRIAKINKRSYIIRGDNCVAFEKVPKKWVVAVANGFYIDGELILTDNAEYREYVKSVLEKGRPFTADEYKQVCLSHGFKSLNTAMPGQCRYEDGAGSGTSYIIKKLFPSFAEMKRKYPILKSLPILLPFLWGRRLIVCIFSPYRFKNALASAAIAFKKKM